MLSERAYCNNLSGGGVSASALGEMVGNKVQPRIAPATHAQPALHDNQFLTQKHSWALKSAQPGAAAATKPAKHHRGAPCTGRYVSWQTPALCTGKSARGPHDAAPWPIYTREVVHLVPQNLYPHTRWGGVPAQYSLRPSKSHKVRRHALHSANSQQDVKPHGRAGLPACMTDSPARSLARS